MPSEGYTDLKSEILSRFDEAKLHHDQFCRLYDRRERAYHGIRDRIGKPKWRHDLRPRYAFNLLETVVASQVEMGLRFAANPAPMVNLTMEQAQLQLAVTEDVEDLLRHEHRVDNFDAKQRPLFLIDGIGGRAPWKSYWSYVPGMTRRQGVVETVVHGPDDSVLGSMPTIVEIETEGMLRDHSTTEVLDPRDFIVHESAQNLDPFSPGGAQYLFHRCWYSFEQLKYLESIGVCHSVDSLKESQDFAGEEYYGREKEVFNISRTKDLIEVIEYWVFRQPDIYYSWLGGRKTIILDETKNPFWHGQYPFGIVSSMPQPFSLNGTSTIELIEALQEMAWELGNQRLDNVELINNAIYLIRSDVEDPDAFEYYPGARWEVEDVQQVAPMTPPYQVAEVSLQAEQLVKGDLQNVTGAAPFAGGTQTATVDQKTATGASIVQNNAQQMMAMKKYTSQQCLIREAQQRLKNCQQFYDGDKLVHVLGPEGATVFKQIPIIAIQGEFLLEIEAMGESQMRQERRAEASNFAQLMVGFAPLAAAAGSPLSIPAIIKWFCERWDIEAPEQFFSTQPAAQGAVAGLPGGGGPPGSPGGGPPGLPPGPSGPNLGVTSSTAVDASQPSATGGLSMSPQVFMQRAAALAGGGQGRNGGGY